MLGQLFVGSFLIVLTILVEMLFIGTAITWLKRFAPVFDGNWKIYRVPVLMGAITLWMLTALTLAVWIWAFAFRLLGIFTTFEEALYLSAVAFTTLGFGDVVIEKPWRLLSGLIAANGLVLFSLSTAVLIEVLRGLVNSAEKEREKAGS